MSLIYVDTNIIMDFLLDRDSSSATFFYNTVRCAHRVVISDLTLKELDYQHVDAMMEILKQAEKLHFHHITRADKKLARKYNARTHYNDALHAAVAKNRKVDFLLTRNIRDFRHLPIRVRHPDDI